MVNMFHGRGLDPIDWPLSVVYTHSGEASRETLRAAHQTLASRHDVLTAEIEPASAALDVADGATYPQQVVRPGKSFSPVEISIGSRDAPVDSRQIRDLLRQEFALRGDTYLPVLLERGGQWSAGALISHVAVDAFGLQVLDGDFQEIVGGVTPRTEPPAVEDIVRSESSKQHREREGRSLLQVRRSLHSVPAEILCQDPPTGRATFGVVESSDHARALARLGHLVGASKATVSLVAYAALLAEDLGTDDILVRSMFRNTGADYGSAPIVSAPFALVHLDIDPELSLRILVQRESAKIIAGYRNANFSPFGYEAVKREVAVERQLKDLDGVPEFNYVPYRGERDVGEVERSWVEFVNDVRPCARGNLSIFETPSHDSVELFGNEWRNSMDSFEFVRRFNRFCMLASTDIDQPVSVLLKRSREAFAHAPVQHSLSTS